MSPSFPKVIVQTFENYAKSQLTFVQNIAELAAKPSFVECLYDSQVVEIVLPLVTNLNPTIRTNAVLGLARLACNSELCAKQMLNSKTILNQLFGQISKENKYYKKNCMSLIKNLMKWPSGNSESLIKECGGMNAIKVCINDFDALVREAALQALGTIARLDACFSQHIVNFGILPLIIVCLKEQSNNLKLHGLLVLDEIAKHNEDLAQRIVESSALPHVICFLSPKFTEVKIQKHALQLIKNIVKHSLFLTENAIEASSNLFSEILLLAAHPDESLRNNAAKVISEVVKHSVQIAKMVVNEGGIASMLNVIECSKESSCTPAVLALGYIAAMSPLLASAVIQSKASTHLTTILKSDADQITKAAAVWTLGMMGQHSSETSRSICSGDTVTAMIDVYKDSKLEDESRTRCGSALQLILNECNDYDVLEKLLTPSFTTDIIAYVLRQISKILPKNTRARRSFIVNGHLKLIQNLNPDVDSELYNIIKAVNCCFPEDIIQMIAGDFPEAVMKAVDKYVPKSQCLFYNRQLKSEEQLSKSSFSAKHQLSGEESFFE